MGATTAPGWRLSAARMRLLVLAIALCAAGCTSVRDYVRHGFKVGPEYCPPSGSVAQRWIEADDARIQSTPGDVARWWTVFQDPVLDSLIEQARSQNLSLREAGLRVLQARAKLGIATGNFFPQRQVAEASYNRAGVSGASSDLPDIPQPILDILGITMPGRFSEQWNFGFSLSWELDFLGRFRRAITAAEDSLEASVAEYDQVMVTLLGDVATNYVLIRTLQARKACVDANIQLQRQVLEIVERRWRGGRTNVVDVAQSRANLAQTQAQVPQLNIEIREAANRLSILMGMPPSALEQQIPTGGIPGTPPAVVLGIPADLLRRRPDLRRIERRAAAQAEQIGIAEADLYPLVSINGTLGYQSHQFSQLFTQDAFHGVIGPSLQWNILNYGRIRNNMLWQTAAFQELVVSYENAVLQAAAEVENGIVRFLQAQEKAKFLDESVKNSQIAVDAVIRLYEGGTADFTRVALIQESLVQQQNSQADAHGQIALGLVQVYRAVGGGWETPEATGAPPLPVAPAGGEELPAPRPAVPAKPDAKPPRPVPAPNAP